MCCPPTEPKVPSTIADPLLHSSCQDLASDHLYPPCSGRRGCKWSCVTSPRRPRPAAASQDGEESILDLANRQQAAQTGRRDPVLRRRFGCCRRGSCGRSCRRRSPRRCSSPSWGLLGGWGRTLAGLSCCQDWFWRRQEGSPALGTCAAASLKITKIDSKG